MCRMDIMLSLILLVSEMLKIPMVNVKARFLKKLAFVIKKCLTKDVFGKRSRTAENFQNTQQYVNSYVHNFSYYLVYSTKLP